MFFFLLCRYYDCATVPLAVEVMEDIPGLTKGILIYINVCLFFYLIFVIVLMFWVCFTNGL
jgi:hypothetical protein